MKLLPKVACLFSLSLFACSGSEPISTSAKELGLKTFTISEFTHEEYPDNPDIGYSSTNYDFHYFKEGKIEPTENSLFTISFVSNNNDTVAINNLDLSEFIPTIPKHIKEDEYLSYIALINQEWNRNQVRFNSSEFVSSDDKITRVDVARNCLNSYLWEVILYTQENEKELPIHHGWFNFPKEMYQQLFEAKNNEPFSKYSAGMENWLDPETKLINSALLREITSNIPAEFTDYSNAMYPLTGARKKKFKEVVTPVYFESMKNLQVDSAKFATFSPPGLYRRNDPRHTELGRIFNLKDLQLSTVKSAANEKQYHEIQLVFTDENAARTTNFILGGIDLKNLPTLAVEDANKAWRSSMGFGNHPFYETYTEHQKCKAEVNPYYAYLSNEKNEWLDSHKVGIDGPMMHKDANNPNLIHLWLLSFERHALVGHYTFTFNPKIPS